MTLIACTFTSNIPILIGDVLVSANQIGRLTLPVNPFKNVSEDVTGIGNLHPIDFIQKIYVISKTTAIAFAGDVFEMKGFYHDFKLFNAYYENNLTDDNIRAFLDRYSRHTFNRSSCLILNLTEYEAGHFMLHYFKVGQRKGGHLIERNELIILGSGERRFLDYTLARSFYKSDVSAGSLDDRILINLGNIGGFLTIEAFTLDTIKNLWGGAYEMILFSNGSFEKMDDVVYIVSKLEKELDGDIRIPMPMIILYQKYYGDLLVVASIPVKNPALTNENGNYIITCKEHGLQYYPISPLIPESTEKKDVSIFQKSFRSNKVVISSILTRPDNQNLLSSFANTRNDLTVEFDYKKEIRIIMRENIFDVIKQRHQEAYRELIQKTPPAVPN